MCLTSPVVEVETAEAGNDAHGESESPVAGLERLVFFSDAVVAIAITLLALDLHVPEHVSNAGFWHDLGRNRDDYLGFLISFAVIGNHWLAHHRTWGRVTRLTGRLLVLNLAWLLMIVVTPLATRIVVANGAFAGRFTLYAAVQALAAILSLLAIHEMNRQDLLGAGTSRETFARGYYQTSVVAVAFLVSIPLAYATHWAYLCWAAIPVAERVGNRLRGRWRKA